MKTTVVITTHPGYQDFIETALKSVKRDQSLDCLAYIADDYQGEGLAKVANTIMSEVITPYVMRLDADDWLHPDAVLTMQSFLETHPDIHAVYSDYYEVDEESKTVRVVEQDKDPHPACMLMRTEVFKELGGYNEKIRRQEGHDFLLRFVGAGYRMHRLSLPLWFYRKHGENMSRTHNDAVTAKHEIDEKLPRILCVIPARGGSKGIPKKNLIQLNGIPLVGHAIRIAKECKHHMLIVVSTDDAEIHEYALSQGVSVIERAPELSGDDVSIIPVAKSAMEYYEDNGFFADIVVTIQPTAPLTPSEKLKEGLDKVLSGAFDSCVSIAELGKHPYRAYYMDVHNVLEPYFPDKSEHYLQRQDRPKAYGFTGGFYIRRRELLRTWTGKGFALSPSTVGVDVGQSHSVDIDTPLDLLVAKSLMEQI